MLGTRHDVPHIRQGEIFHIGRLRDVLREKRLHLGLWSEPRENRLEGREPRREWVAIGVDGGS